MIAIFKKLYNKISKKINDRLESIKSLHKNPYVSPHRYYSEIGFNYKISDLYNYCVFFDVFSCEKHCWDMSNNFSFSWNMDHKTNVTWPSKWHKLMPYKLHGSSDVKLMWELGRGQVFTHTALGVYDGQVEMGSFERMIIDFIEKNKPGYGVQWQCPMDVSIRLVNTIVSHGILKKSDKEINADLKYRFEEMYSCHYLFIIKNLEVFGNDLRNNHYLADLLGKAWYYSFVTSDLEAAESLNDVIQAEILNQFMEDGSNFEGSIAYHFLSTEIIILSLIAIAQLYIDSKKPLPSIVSDRLVLAIKFATEAVSKTGHPSRIGDDDSGMVIRPHDLSRIPLLDKSSRIAQRRIAAFNKFIELYDNNADDIISPIINILLGIDNTDINFNNRNSFNYANFGLYKISSNKYEIFFRHLKELGSNGLGGHNHEDDMNVEIFFDGNPVIVDPGSYCYTANSEDRNLFRSSRYHNGPTIAGVRFFDYKPDIGWLFKMLDKRQKSVIDSNADSVSIISEGRGSVISRLISLNNNFNIVDKTEVKKSRTIFHFHPSISLNIVNDKVEINDFLVMSFSGVNALNLTEYYYSDFYLNKCIASSLVVDFDFEFNVSFLEDKVVN